MAMRLKEKCDGHMVMKGWPQTAEAMARQESRREDDAGVLLQSERVLNTGRSDAIQPFLLPCENRSGW